MRGAHGGGGLTCTSYQGYLDPLDRMRSFSGDRRNTQEQVSFLAWWGNESTACPRVESATSLQVEISPHDQESETKVVRDVLERDRPPVMEGDLKKVQGSPASVEREG
jgi:hypothetical protein